MTCIVKEKKADFELSELNVSILHKTVIQTTCFVTLRLQTKMPEYARMLHKMRTKPKSLYNVSIKVVDPFHAVVSFLCTFCMPMNVHIIIMLTKNIVVLNGEQNSSSR